MDGPTSHPPVCHTNVVHDGNYAATLDIEVAVAEDSMDEDVMARWLILNGPLSVALDAYGMDFYSDGIDMGEVRDENSTWVNKISCRVMQIRPVVNQSVRGSYKGAKSDDCGTHQLPIINPIMVNKITQTK